MSHLMLESIEIDTFFDVLSNDTNDSSFCRKGHRNEIFSSSNHNKNHDLLTTPLMGCLTIESLDY